jgi:hypothetical protein
MFVRLRPILFIVVGKLFYIIESDCRIAVVRLSSINQRKKFLKIIFTNTTGPDAIKLFLC